MEVSISSKLHNYVLSKGGVLTIDIYPIMKGWWNVVKMLSGKMALPDNLIKFNKFQFKEISIYISQDQFDSNMKIFIPYFGTETIEIR